MGPALYETVFSAHFSYGIRVQKQYNFVYYKKTLYEICVCWRMKTLRKREKINMKT